MYFTYHKRRETFGIALPDFDTLKPAAPKKRGRKPRAKIDV